LHKLKGKTFKVELNRRIDYKFSFPASLIMPKGSFIIEQQNDHSIFTATLSFRLGWLLSKLAKSRVAALKQHMREEGENLKQLLEKGSNEVR
jgi:hypothetical protein